MSSNSLPRNSAIGKSLTRQQRRVWCELTTAPPEALTPAGRVPTAYLATAWPDDITQGVGWQNLIRVTIYGINQRLKPHGVRIVGAHAGPGGYVIVTTKERTA